jgi:hypothetical protein
MGDLVTVLSLALVESDSTTSAASAAHGASGMPQICASGLPVRCARLSCAYRQ